MDYWQPVNLTKTFNSQHLFEFVFNMIDIIWIFMQNLLLIKLGTTYNSIKRFFESWLQYYLSNLRFNLFLSLACFCYSWKIGFCLKITKYGFIAMIWVKIDEEKNLCFLNKTIGLHLILSRSFCALHVTPIVPVYLSS